LNTIYLCI